MADCFVKIADSITRFVGAIAWPLIAVVCLCFFGPAVKAFLSNLSEASLEAFGVKASGRAQALGTALAQASAKRIDQQVATNQQPPGQALAEALGQSFKAAKAIATPDILKQIKGKRILWVDDQPSNNVFERNALETLGFSVVEMGTTELAINILKKSRIGFDVVISDMSRPESPRAGYDLLKQMTDIGLYKPVIFYSSSNTPDQQAEAKRAGAWGSTTEPDDLVRLVVESASSPNLFS